MGQKGYQDGSAEEALFNNASALAFDRKGNLYVADRGNFRIRKISLDGIVSTIAGSGEIGDKLGPAIQAQFRSIQDIKFDKQQNLYISENRNQNGCLFKMDVSGRIDKAGQCDTRPISPTALAIHPSGEAVYFIDGAIKKYSLTSKPASAFRP